MDPVLMTFNELSLSLGARLFPGEGGEEGFRSVSVNSRNLDSGALFVALTGAAQDGHSFIEAALDAGAAGIMAAQSQLESRGIVSLVSRRKKALVVVENTLRGLQNAARTYLEKFPRLLKIAVTGSSGKTTTKEIAASIIGQEKKVVMNSGNFNSETGLPLSVFNVREEHEVGIFEAGMNRQGEIGELAEVLKPDIALVTNIGSAHIGILGSKGAIAEEKKAIFSCFTGNQTALIPLEDEYAGFLSSGVKGRTVLYGAGAFPELGRIRDLGLDGTEINWAGRAVTFPLPGPFNLKNAVAALAIAREIPISAKGVAQGMEAVKPLFGRGEILRGAVTLIRDCYNSNPESLEATLSYCDSLSWSGRRIYVIGSMLELGDLSEKSHGAAGAYLASSRADYVFLFGKECEIIADRLSGGGIPFFWTVEMEELKRALAASVKPGDLVLLKGSRGCALEQLTPLLAGEEIKPISKGGV